jgi:hypothetical protein
LFIGRKLHEEAISPGPLEWGFVNHVMREASHALPNLITQCLSQHRTDLN